MLEGGWPTVALSLGWPLDNLVTQNWEVCLGLKAISLPPPLSDHKTEACSFFVLPIVSYLCAELERQNQTAFH